MLTHQPVDWYIVYLILILGWYYSLDLCSLYHSRCKRMFGSKVCPSVLTGSGIGCRTVQQDEGGGGSRRGVATARPVNRHPTSTWGSVKNTDSVQNHSLLHSFTFSCFVFLNVFFVAFSTKQSNPWHLNKWTQQNKRQTIKTVVSVSVVQATARTNGNLHIHEHLHHRSKN